MMHDHSNGHHRSAAKGPSNGIAMVRAILPYLDPHCSYTDWFQIGAAIHTVTQGSEAALDLYDNWSAGSSKYPTRRKLEQQWGYFGRNRGRAFGMPTLRRHVEQAGGDWGAICWEAECGGHQ